ncbi:MAG: molybdopterin biosynthesis protein [Deltaproteobacteria bacterium]|nr:MAG: molybdopterin biosynthesis protein [Deltaproteobacteria bacterium]
MERNIYLDLLTIPQALARVTAALDRDGLIQQETIPSHEAGGRVLAQAVYARTSSPTFHSAAMDGIAVKAASTFGAREGRPLLLVRDRDYIPVNTGNPLPDGMDAVIMIEEVLEETDKGVTIEKGAFPMQHVRRIGEDIVATELLLPQNHTLSPYDIGALLSAGIWEVSVWEPVRITIIPTGDEVLDFTTRPVPKAGQVIESNSQVFLNIAKAWNCTAQRIPPVPDDPLSLKKALAKALEEGAHVVILGAGSSAGTKDYTKAVINELGEVLVHGIAVMPGKPSILGVVEGRLVVGAPGYPVSAVVCIEELLGTIVAWLSRTRIWERPEITVEMARTVPSKLGLEERIRLAIGKVGTKNVAIPLTGGAGMITSLTKAHGMTSIPATNEGVEQGTRVQASLLVPEKELQQTLLVIGSHDNTIDLLANGLMGLEAPIYLASSHVGSMGGLMALQSGSTMIAGAHLFDPETEDYNYPFIRTYLPDMDLVVVNLAIRHQGLIVAHGNPLGIEGLEDLATKRARFVNRQRGAGTRILFDHALQQKGLKPSDIQGYGCEEFTHMALAANVLTGVADCGLGIFAAARALNLDFIPLARERYDLLIPKVYVEEPKIQTLLALIRQETTQEQIKALGGYETTLTGHIMEPGQGLG